MTGTNDPAKKDVHRAATAPLMVMAPTPVGVRPFSVHKAWTKGATYRAQVVAVNPAGRSAAITTTVKPAQ